MEAAAPRLDQWLWFARLVKTRGEAQALCAGGCVRLNGAAVGRGQRRVRIGDRIEVFRRSAWRFVTVRGFAAARLSAVAAVALYVESRPPLRLAPGDDLPSPEIAAVAALTGSAPGVSEIAVLSDFFD